MYRLYYEQVLPGTLDACWEYFSDPKNLEKITPRKMNFKIETGADHKMYSGQIITYKIKLLPLVRIQWVTEITHVKEGDYFVDEQRFGPYKFWHHQHKFTEVDRGVKVEDIVSYKLPFGILGRFVHFLFIKRQLHQIFEFRKEAITKINF